MEITAECPYCNKLNTYEVRPNEPVMVTCSCKMGSFYVKKVDRIEVVRNSLWIWEKSPVGDNVLVGKNVS